jgi:hypothetical protein
MQNYYNLIYREEEREMVSSISTNGEWNKTTLML